MSSGANIDAPAPPGCRIRELQRTDYGKGFLQLLAQLTTVGDISEDAFVERWQQLQASPDYHVAVAEDETSNRLVGTATLLVERKFIHDCGMVGHIEDVVVDASARGQHLGQRLIHCLVQAAAQRGCYKVILDCSEDNVPFYSKCGLTRKEVQMVRPGQVPGSLKSYGDFTLWQLPGVC